MDKFKEYLKEVKQLNKAQVQEKIVSQKKQLIGVAVFAVIALSLPVSLILLSQRQDVRQHAAETQISSIVFQPQSISLSSPLQGPVRMSVLAYDTNGNPVFSQVTYEWGISSTNSVGTLTEVSGSVATFLPKNVGVGDIFVTAKTASQVLTRSIPVTIGVIPTATPSPTNTPSPTPQVFNGFKGEYFANKDLAGSPSLIRNDPEINFYWTGVPESNIPADNFSVRWTKNQQFTTGKYAFKVRHNDGMRVWVDNNLYYNHWTQSSQNTKTFIIRLSEGLHSIRVEYNELQGIGYAYLSWYRQ